MVKFDDFDRNLRQKTVMSDAFVLLAARPHSAAAPVYDDYKAAFTFCDKYNKGLHQGSWPYKQVVTIILEIWDINTTCCPICVKTHLTLILKQT